MNTKQAIATATFKDTWAGELSAYLLPFLTKRRGEATIRYRWMTERGSTCDGLAFGLGAERMIGHAQRHPLFSNVAVES